MGHYDRDRLPLPVDFFEAQGISLKGGGLWRTGQCPMHGGGSLRVNTQSGGWICMGCGEHGGDVLAFLMVRDGLSFVDAARSLGAWDEVTGGRHTPSRRRLLPASDLLPIVLNEARTVLLIGHDLVKKHEPSRRDYERLLLACSRLEKLCDPV